MAIAGTLASTRALFGLSHVFPQSSILYGPRCCSNSSSALAGGIRSIQATPAAVRKAARRVMRSLFVDMVRLLCLGALHGAVLSITFPEADRGVGSRDKNVRSGAACRLCGR